jgi:YHS domain-containing protein
MKGTHAARWCAAVISTALLTTFAACQDNPGAAVGPVSRVAQTRSTGEGIDPSRVCFINNKYMGEPQIPVAVDGKTYYGCCAGCVTALRNDPSSRVATDPHSGTTVDKATAFIARDPADAAQVLYFESADTFAAFARNVH